MPNIQITRADFYDDKQVEILCSVCEKKAFDDMRKGRTTWVRRWMIVHLALYTGLRVSELTRVKAEHIHLKEMYMEVFRSKKKNSDGHGTLPLSKDIAEHLAAYMKWFNFTEGAIFRTNKPMGINGIAMHWRRAVEATDLPYISIHGARHSCVSNIINKHGIKAAQEWVQHASIQTTANIYGHISFDTMRNIAESMYK